MKQHHAYEDKIRHLQRQRDQAREDWAKECDRNNRSSQSETIAWGIVNSLRECLQVSQSYCVQFDEDEFGWCRNPDGEKHTPGAHGTCLTCRRYRSIQEALKSADEKAAEARKLSRV